jgi:uncharacterized protein YpuA (DUF1002 family)
MTIRPRAARPIAAFALAILPAAALAQAPAPSTGIPACDGFYRDYEACIMQRMPEAQRGIFRQTLEQSRAKVREQAADPEDRPSAERTCREQRTQASRLFAQYNCTFN